MHRFGFMALVFLCAAMAGPASAFTYDTHTAQNPNGSFRFTDPEDKFSSGNKSAEATKNNGFSLHFNNSQTPQSGVQSRFLPSANDAFSSPFTRESDFSRSINRTR